jgi:hypothetical protein
MKGGRIRRVPLNGDKFPQEVPDGKPRRFIVWFKDEAVRSLKAGNVLPRSWELIWVFGGARSTSGGR